MSMLSSSRAAGGPGPASPDGLRAAGRRRGPARARFGIIGGLLLLGAALLGGCSALQFTYGQAPRFAMIWLDRYADFRDDQTPQVRAALDEWFAWHRRTQLPAYADELERWQRKMEGELDAQEICRAMDDWRGRIGLAMAQGLPKAAPLLLTLDDGQIRHIARHQAESLDDAAKEQLQPDPAERRAKALERTRERSEWLYGALGREQVAVLAASLAESAPDPEAAMAARRARQQRFIRRLQEWRQTGASAAVVEAGLREELGRLFDPPEPAEAERQRRNRQAACSQMARLHAATTPEQRRRAAERLGRWAADFRLLSRGG